MLDLSPLLVLFTCGLLFLTIRRHRTREISHFPPGPRKLPVVGNLLDIPVVMPWLRFSQWQKQYGDLVHISIFGHHIVIINSTEVANDLLEKRSRIFSDRPKLPLIDFLGGGFAIPMMPYGNVWRKHRAILQQKFRANEVISFHSLELSKAHDLIRDLSETPKEFMVHVKNYTGGVTMHVAYGYKTAAGPDPILELADEMTRMFTDSLLKATIMHMFPMFQNLVEWFPGSNHKRSGQQARGLVSQVLELPFRFVKQSMANGTAKPSFTSDQLETIERTGNETVEVREQFIKETAANIYIAGTDTMNAALNSFILAMAMHQGAQKKAQSEIDTVIGHDRLPNFSDRKSLPFVEAVYKEVLRYRPVTPLGECLPHAATEDNYYGGYLIPEGTTIIPNVWSMTRDERLHANPDDFLPERYLTSDGQINDDSVPLSYGFGRRICVGLHLAEDTLWIAIASILSVFDIRYAKDGSGRDIEVQQVYPDNLVSTPPPFLCSISPRSEDKRKLAQMADAHL